MVHDVNFVWESIDSKDSTEMVNIQFLPLLWTLKVSLDNLEQAYV